MINNPSLSFVSLHRRISNRLNSANARYLEGLKNSQRAKEDVIIYSEKVGIEINPKSEEKIRQREELKEKNKADKEFKDAQSLELEKWYQVEFERRVTHFLKDNTQKQVLLNNSGIFITEGFVLCLTDKLINTINNLICCQILGSLTKDYFFINPIIIYENINGEIKSYLYSDTKFLAEIAPFDF